MLGMTDKWQGMTSMLFSLLEMNDKETQPSKVVGSFLSDLHLSTCNFSSLFKFPMLSGSSCRSLLSVKLSNTRLLRCPSVLGNVTMPVLERTRCWRNCKLSRLLFTVLRERVLRIWRRFKVVKFSHNWSKLRAFPSLIVTSSRFFNAFNSLNGWALLVLVFLLLLLLLLLLRDRN